MSDTAAPEINILNATKIAQTINRLQLRVSDRFPDSGLLRVASQLHEVALETDQTIRWIEKPGYLYRSLGIFFLILVVAALAFAFTELDWKVPFGISSFVSMSEAALNEIVLLGAGVAFIVSLDLRRKRRRIISALSQLRSIAHVIDAHQLTKDPSNLGPQVITHEHSPKRTLTSYQLKRYLDYCSELLSLTSKVAFLYVQKFDDPISVNAVYELENLTTGLSRKIWQKIMVLQAATGAPESNSNT